MAKFPVRFSIKCSVPKGKEEVLTYIESVRFIPGNRHVVEAVWNGKSVIVKKFFHKLKAKRHLKREWRGLHLLRKRRSPYSIRPLFCGRTDDGGWAVAMEKILDSNTALDIFKKATDGEVQLDLLLRICREVAAQHEKGIFQTDLHLGNFLISGKDVFALDPGQMRFFLKPISRKRSLTQLAVLSGYLPEDDIHSTTRLYNEYFKFRHWQFRITDERFLKKKRSAIKKHAVRKQLKKALRTSTRYQRVRIGDRLAVFDKNFFSHTEWMDFMAKIDGLMAVGKVLKQGNTCWVSHISWGDKDVVVKRYNHKNMIHSFRHTIKRSRARRGWLHGHRLGMFDIATPRPLAYIEERKGLFVRQSYLVNEYISGQKLNDLLENGRIDEAQRMTIMEQVAAVMDRMGKYRITHGDLKHSNIIIADRPVLTDLDGMKISRLNWLYKRRRDRDIRRLHEPET